MTPTPSVLLDTDVLSGIMRRNPQAVVRAREYLTEHQRFTFSVITRYEVLRGLLAKGATTQRYAFDRLCTSSELLPLTESVVLKAADIYADLYRRGALIGDADILIAATALANGYTLASNNESHMRRIPDLQLDNWLAA